MTKTTCLETSKKLKAAGFPQDTELHWEIVGKNGIIPASSPFITRRTNADNEQYAAPNTDEILEELPHNIDLFRLEIYKGIKRYGVAYYFAPSQIGKKEFQDESLSEALAQMYLWLASERLLEGKK